jgi:uncharacterized membrane protein
MDEPASLEARVAALEGEIQRLRASLAPLEAWASYYGVKTAHPGPAAATTATAAVPGAAVANIAPGLTSTSDAPAVAAKTQLGGEQMLIRVMYGVGILVLLIGAAIFIPSLSALGPHLRVLVGIAVGIALISAGARRANTGWQPLGLLALGAGLEYLSLWYAHATDIAPVGICAFAMFAVTGMLGSLAYIHRSERIAFAGLLGGYLTPLLIATDTPALLSLNLYLIVLGAAALGLGVVCRFRYVEFAAVAFVALYSTQWGFSFDANWHPLEALGASIVYFAEFSAALIIGARAGDDGVARRVLLSLEIFAFATFLAHRSINVNGWEGAGFGFTLLALAVVALLGARSAALARPLRLIFGWWALGAVLLAVQSVVPGMGDSGGFAVEGAVLAGIAAGTQQNGIRLGSALAFTIAFCISLYDWLSALWGHGSSLAGTQPFFNAPLAEYALIAIALVAAIELERRGGTPPTGWLAILRVALQSTIAWTLAVQAFAVISADEPRSLLITALWTIDAALLIASGVRTRRGLLRGMGVALFVVVVFKVFLVDLSGVDPLVRFLSFLGVGLALVGVASGYNRALKSAAVTSDTASGGETAL